MNKSNYSIFISFFIVSGVSLTHILEYFDIEIRYGGISLEFFYWFIYIIFFLVLILLFKKDKNIFQVIYKSNIKLFLIYVAYILISCFRSDYKVDGVKMFLNVLLPCLTYILTYQYSLKSDSNSRNIDKILWLALGLNLFIGFLLTILGRPIFMSDYTGTVRLIGSMGWATFAYFLMPYIIILYSNILLNKKNSVLQFIGLIILIILVLLTVSRTAILGLVLILVLGVFLSGKISFQKIMLGLILFIPLSLLVWNKLAQRNFVNKSGYVATSGRLTSAIYLTTNNINSPLDVIVGVGSGTSTVQVKDLDEFGIDSTHSYLINTFVDHGIIGIFLLLLFPIKIYFRLLKGFKAKFYNVRPFLSILFLFPLIIFDNFSTIFTISILFSMIAVYEAKIANGSYRKASR